MATTTIDSSGNTKMSNYRNRQVTYWIIGGVILMAVLFYFLLRPQNMTTNSNMGGTYTPNSATDTNQNTNGIPGTNTTRDGATPSNNDTTTNQ